MLAAGSFAVGQVIGGRETPAAVARKAKRDILRMVVSVVENHVEDTSFIGLQHFAFIVCEKTGQTQEGRVVDRRRDAEIGIQRAGEGMRRYAPARIAIEALRS